MSTFHIGNRIGSGGFGVVHEVSHVDSKGRETGEQFAMKSLADHHLEDHDAVARFVREVRLQSEELGHPNIIEVASRNLSAWPPYFVMPLAESNLQQQLDAGRAGDREWVLFVFRQVLAGMAHAHDRDEPIVHRDLKPLNILFVGGVPKVADFGLGKRLAPGVTTLTQTDASLGTEIYMAPEQFGGAKQVGPQADVYALGKVLWQMLTGAYPELLYVDLEAVPLEFRWFIERCTRREPADRYRTAGEALAAFELFTQTPGLRDSPLEGAERLVAEWVTAAPPERLPIVLRVDEHLNRNAGEEELFFKVVPRLPEDLVDFYMDNLREPFVRMLTTYDQHISSGLPFAYCDVVADFYARLWRRTTDLALRRSLLARLLAMGASHNRWYVGGVVASLLEEVEDISTAMVVAEMLRADPYHAAWYWRPWIEPLRLLDPIAEAFDDVKEDDGG